MWPVYYLEKNRAIMRVKLINKAEDIGFCWGVQRAIEIVDREVIQRGSIDSLGSIVHNQRVMDHLQKLGVRVIDDLPEVKGDAVIISTHGTTPEVIAEIERRHLKLIDTTCPFVRRAQLAARKLARLGFFIVIFGDQEHPEVRGILGWAGGHGMATLKADEVRSLRNIPKRLGILSQTTQVVESFVDFSKEILDYTLDCDSEIRIIDTICHDIRRRQESAARLASNSEVVLVIGGSNSANTRHLAELCLKFAATYQIEGAQDINPAWLKGKEHIGIVSGTSTDTATIQEVLSRVEGVIEK